MVPFKIGRGSQEKNDLSLDEDTSVSRGHAVITYEGGQFYLADQGSSNGTMLDDVRLAPRTPTALYDGAHIVFGKGTEVTFKVSGGPQAPGRGPDIDPDKTDYVNISQVR
jgi:pSer/pThr/pTyr-binding forkhead associated (FHA) protein